MDNSRVDGVVHSLENTQSERWCLCGKVKKEEGMKKSVVSFFVTGAVVGWLACAQATTISVFNNDTQTAEINAWIAAQGGQVTVLEDFEGVQSGLYNSLTTSLGTFSAPGNNQFDVRDQPNTWSRTNYTPGGSNFLDSNDRPNITLTMNSSQPLYNLFFYIQDPADGWPFNHGHTASTTNIMAFDTDGQPADYTFQGSTDPHGNSAYDGQRWFVGITTNSPILQIEFIVNNPWDGYGLDYFSTVTSAPVPEPATMLLFGTGLAGLAGLRRRQGRK